MKIFSKYFISIDVNRQILYYLKRKRTKQKSLWRRS